MNTEADMSHEKRMDDGTIDNNSEQPKTHAQKVNKQTSHGTPKSLRKVEKTNACEKRVSGQAND